MKKIILLVISAIIFISWMPPKKEVVYNLEYIIKNMKYIPAGSFLMTPVDDPTQEKLKDKTITVSPFYMLNQEVSNGMYNWYMKEVRAKGDTAAYKAVLPDTLVWREKLSYNEPYVEYYLRHPAYAHYPLVGVNYEQCMNFCKWLTEKYNTDPKREFKKVRFDLPDSAQRQYAARGGMDFSPFPWGGPYMHNKQGKWLANFKVIDQASVWRMEIEVMNVYGKKETHMFLVGGGGNHSAVAGYLSDNADITVPVISYSPNGYGLYNMSGNVEEYIKSRGKTMGGSWQDTGYYLQNNVYEEYNDTTKVSCERGFRFIMIVEEEFEKKK